MIKRYKKYLVSLIVPVYNVARYLDDCVKSLLDQTYQNIEILLIDDGSTDSSFQKCDEWAKKDTRIRCFHKQNEGLGPTRDFGVRQVRGNYFCFVDSDDWVDRRYVELLYRAIVSESADIAECDFYRCRMDSGDRSITYATGVMGDDFTREQEIAWGNTAQCNKMFRREFYVDAGIRQPALPAEDVAVFALEIALAKKRAAVHQSLYFYRKQRPGSISSTSQRFFRMPEALQYLLESFQIKGIFRAHKAALLIYSLRWGSRILVPLLGKVLEEDYRKLRAEWIALVREKFPFWKGKRGALWGSYNLTKVVQNSCVFEDPYERFQFSSLISLLSTGNAVPSSVHRNPYRKVMLQRDFSCALFPILRKECPDVLVLDFIEERHDIIEKGGTYLTKSDALSESDLDMTGWRIIPRDSEEARKLFHRACQRLLYFCRQELPSMQLILARTLLATEHGNRYIRKPFAEAERLRQQNDILRRCYDDFRLLAPEVPVIDVTQDALYLSDDEFEYGCHPWHLNHLINEKMGKGITAVLRRGDWKEDNINVHGGGTDLSSN